MTVVRSTIASAQKTLTEGYDDDAAPTPSRPSCFTVVFGDVDPSGPFWSVQPRGGREGDERPVYDARAEMFIARRGPRDSNRFRVPPDHRDGVKVRQRGAQHAETMGGNTVLPHRPETENDYNTRSYHHDEDSAPVVVTEAEVDALVRTRAGTDRTPDPEQLP